MTQRRTDGWAGIVEVDEEQPADQTIVNLTSPFADEKTPVTPPSGMDAVDGRRALQLPVPAAPAIAAGRKVSKVDELEGKRGRGPAKAAAFSGDAFVNRIAGPLRSKPPAPASTWREYREVIITGVVGLMVLSAAIAWRVMSPKDEPTVQETSGPMRAGQRPKGPPPKLPVASVAPTPTASASPTPIIGAVAAEAPPTPDVDVAPVPTAVAVPTPAPTASAAPVLAKAAKAMLTIITVPSEADVEIDHQFVGKTPLITTAPEGTTMLTVRISKAGHETYEQQLVPNEGGHFSASVTLVPLKK